MKATLEHLVHCCQGDDRPECPILAELAGDTSGAAPTASPRLVGKPGVDLGVNDAARRAAKPPAMG